MAQYTPPDNDSADFGVAESNYSAPSNDSADFQAITTRTKIGTARIDKSGTVLDVPIYDPADLSDDWLRIRLEDGTVGALRIINKSGEPLRTRRGGAVYGIETQ